MEEMTKKPECIEITQKSGIGNTTQVAVQNNYVGLSPSEASELALNLFMDNFPKLQEAAGEIAKQRADELCEEAIKRIIEKGVKDLSAFEDPGVQFSLYEAQKGYAKYGGEYNLNCLSELISNRVIANKKAYLSRVFDKAIEISGMLTERHLDYLSVIFLVKMAKFPGINTTTDLRTKLEEIARIFPVDYRFSVNMVPFLNMIGCFELNLGSAAEVLGRIYGFSRGEIDRLLPKQYDCVPGDYALSPAGIVLAIVNAQNKTKYTFDYNTWIHE